VQRVSGFYKTFVETELEENDRLIFEWASRQTYLALGNLMTAAAQIGIDSSPIEGFDKEKVTSVLQIEYIINANDFGVAYMVAFGYRQEDPKRPKARQNLDERRTETSHRDLCRASGINENSRSLVN
jgi:nitroreductase